MRRAVLALMAVAVVVAGIDVLADLTQDRPDRVPAGSRSEIVLDVHHRSTGAAGLRSAQGLWGACQSTVWQHLAEPGVVPIGDGRFLLATSPAVGEHAWRRLQGCLEDMTIDRVRARVVSKRDVVEPDRG
jgi:hypothetical protein